MKTIKLLTAYTAALVTVLFWWLVVQIACLCDKDIRTAWQAGEALDHIDPAISRLDALHIALFGSDE